MDSLRRNGMNRGDDGMMGGRHISVQIVIAHCSVRTVGQDQQSASRVLASQAWNGNRFHLSAVLPSDLFVVLRRVVPLSALLLVCTAPLRQV